MLFINSKWSKNINKLDVVSAQSNPWKSFIGKFKPPCNKNYLPLSLISKQILKHDCMISQTDSFVMCTPTGLSSSVRNTCEKKSTVPLFLKQKKYNLVKRSLWYHSFSNKKIQTYGKKSTVPLFLKQKKYKLMKRKLWYHSFSNKKIQTYEKKSMVELFLKQKNTNL